MLRDTGMDVSGDFSRHGTHGRGVGVGVESLWVQCALSAGRQEAGWEWLRRHFRETGQTQCRQLLSRPLRVGSLPCLGV